MTNKQVMEIVEDKYIESLVKEMQDALNNKSKAVKWTQLEILSKKLYTIVKIENATSEIHCKVLKNLGH